MVFDCILASMVRFACELMAAYDAIMDVPNNTFIKEDKASKADDYHPRQYRRREDVGEGVKV